MSGYPVGTQVEDKDGRIKIKLPDGKWISRARYEYMKAKKADLDGNQRVFCIDGDRQNHDIKNLVPITFNGTRYSIAHSRVIYSPTRRRLQLAGV